MSSTYYLHMTYADMLLCCDCYIVTRRRLHFSFSTVFFSWKKRTSSCLLSFITAN